MSLECLLNHDYVFSHSGLHDTRHLVPKGCVGVYYIRGPRGRYYIGSSYSRHGVWGRIESHRRGLVKGIHNPKLQRSWDNHGGLGFVYGFLELYDRSTTDKDFIRDREQYYIDTYKPYIGGYNCQSRAVINHYEKRHMNQEHKDKIRKAQLKHYQDPEHVEVTRQASIMQWTDPKRRAMPGPNTGKRFSEETKKKMSQAKKGRKLTDEQKQRCREIAARPDVIEKKRQKALAQWADPDRATKIREGRWGSTTPDNTTPPDNLSSKD